MNMIDKDSVRVQAGASAPFTCATSIPARGGTNCTGDTIQGTPVISQLDVQDLEPGKSVEGASWVGRVEAEREIEASVQRLKENPGLFGHY